MAALSTRRLGADGPAITSIGLGCMSMSWAYYLGERDDDESVRVVRRAIEAGVRHLDTASMYGPFTNERIVGRALAGGVDGVVVASKCGLVVDDPVRRVIRRDGTPEGIRRTCDESLQRLGLDVIDLYYLHRVDPAVPVEESWGALAELVAAGKVRHLGLSECTTDELERAHAIHPVAALQSELSLWTRDRIADGQVAWCAAHGVTFVAFGVVGRGFLTGALAPGTAFRADDFRASNPRFTPEAMAANMALVERLRAIGARHGATPAQVCIAWVLALGAHVVAIPGTKQRAYLDEDLGADALRLSAEDIAELDALPPAVGSRYA